MHPGFASHHFAPWRGFGAVLWILATAAAGALVVWHYLSTWISLPLM
ncbi:MAG TPA: hypothetical protein VMI94_13685 [Bryobacteraceae bacterium]|nr:hypothetical protein [Bryobacteraceae bacterium]